MQLDRQQQKAVKYKKSNLLVLAGPGSGKTTVLTGRIQYLTDHEDIPEKKILVLTFTKAAADEMKERYKASCKKSRTEVTFGTFHSVFLKELLRYSKYPFELIDRRQEISVIREVYGKICSGKECTTEDAERILDDISRSKNGLEPELKITTLIINELNKGFYYDNKINFDDILIRFLRLLIDDPNTLFEIRSKYEFILIDEFQDINRIQYEIVKLICGRNGCIFAVGDDDQSIYGFRGSDPTFMQEFIKDFKGCGKILLDTNYRSTGIIVNTAKNLISHNKIRFQKNIKAIRREGLKFEVREFNNEDSEGQYICECISKYETYAEKYGISSLSYAVLSRTNNTLQLIRNSIPKSISERISFHTFHSSKGLEYDVVFISHMNEDVIPGRNSDNKDILEEERRVFYVAITRCKTYLHIFYTCNEYNMKSNKSRFINELNI